MKYICCSILPIFTFVSSLLYGSRRSTTKSEFYNNQLCISNIQVLIFNELKLERKWLVYFRILVTIWFIFPSMLNVL